MSTLGLVLVVGVVFLTVGLSPRVGAWFSRDSSGDGLRTELEALERKKEMLRQMKTPVSSEQARQPPAA